MLRHIASFAATDFPDPHCDATLPLHPSFHYTLGTPARAASSFYVDCGFFGASGAASPSDISASGEREALELKLSQFEQLTHPEDQRIADPAYKVKVTPDVNSALNECLRTKECSAFCRNEAGSTTFHRGKLTMGFGDPEKDSVVDRGPWTCIARNGYVSADHIAGDHVEKCWQNMEDATQGAWNDTLVPVDKIVGPKGDSVKLVLEDASPVNREDLEDTKMRCEQDDNCEAICVHEKAPYRGVLFGHFEKAKCALDPDQCRKIGEEQAERVNLAPGTHDNHKGTFNEHWKQRNATKKKWGKPVVSRHRDVSVAPVAEKNTAVHPTITSAYAPPQTQRPIQRRMDSRLMPSASLAGSFLGGEQPSSASTATSSTKSSKDHGLICPKTEIAEAEARKANVAVTHGSCVICKDSKIGRRSLMPNSKTGKGEYLNDIFFLPSGKASEAIAQGYCEAGLGEDQQFPCSCLDDSKVPNHRWADHTEFGKPGGADETDGMLVECSMKCREAALKAAKVTKSPKGFAALSLDDAVRVGYSLLTPKGIGDDELAKLDKSFWPNVLQPAKKAESTWLKKMFPEEDPDLSPKHPGASPVVKELSSPYGAMGDDDQGHSGANAANDGAEHPDFNGWKCYYLPKKCRAAAKQRTEEHMQKVQEEVERKRLELREFDKALRRDPVNLPQGLGTDSSAEYWAKTSAPVIERTDSGIVVKSPGRTPPRLSGDDPRIQDWYGQCKNVPSILPLTAQKMIPWEDKMFDAELKFAGTRGKTFIHQTNGRWLECIGGLGHSKSQPSTLNPYASVNPLSLKNLKCRALHEEPLENCLSCPADGKDAAEFRCLGKGWTGIPQGEYSPVRSLLRPVAPVERPDEEVPGSSSALLAAREMSTPANIAERAKPPVASEASGLSGLMSADFGKFTTSPTHSAELRCIHIGHPGDIQSVDADRVIFAAAALPAPVLIAAMVAPKLNRPSQVVRSRRHKMQDLELFL